LEPVIVIQNLSYTYPDGKLALEDINLQIGAGEKVALIGPNGAGKSTLLLHINGIFSGQGSITVGGQELNTHNLGQIRARVGLVFQNPDDQLFSSTVYEDIAYGPIYQGYDKETVHRLVVEALEAVQMPDYASRNPFHLSLGEKKRLSIATVLSMKPEILVLDEPSAGLDPCARRELIALLQQLPQAMLIASHDMDLVSQLASRTVIINQGRITADRPTRAVLSDEALLFASGLR